MVTYPTTPLRKLVEIKKFIYNLNLFLLYKMASKEVERVERLAAVSVVSASNNYLHKQIPALAILCILKCRFCERVILTRIMHFCV